MNKEQIIKQNRACMNTLRKHQKMRLHKMNNDITELNSEIAILNKEIAILNKEIAIIIKEQTVRKIEDERQELEKTMV